MTICSWLGQNLTCKGDYSWGNQAMLLGHFPSLDTLDLNLLPIINPKATLLKKLSHTTSLENDQIRGQSIKQVPFLSLYLFVYEHI